MALNCNKCGGVIPDIGGDPFDGCNSHIKPEVNLSDGLKNLPYDSPYRKRYNDIQQNSVPNPTQGDALAARFKKVYANIPLGLRSDVIAVIDDQPLSWNVVYIEVSTDSPMAGRILEYLDELELI